ncbi:Trk system potassium transporter TrkA [Oribacterium sp. WCC10]|uniref:Trk system potassium transporter TrkA n=1 Tax=Oribacterium sp. WCC10 TaxID=1855343 RepID=UPI0008E0AF55|nr:Trk system potassium transporter TrkA [Oribacterium sp. WCC10]SFG08741.1 trk system potassium uptake protein TrkA [Oribacterium sp. WCC10]
MNIIVVGCGKVGLTLAAQLNKENHNITIIDHNEKALRHAVDTIDVMGINGNGAMLKTQQEAGVKNADVLIAATDSDEINMLCCLIAKKEGNCSTIARIRNPEYTDEITYLRDELNLAMVINPEMAAAKEVSRLLRFPSAMKIDSFSRGKIDLIRVKVPEHSEICGMKIMDISRTLGINLLICSIERGEEVIIPSGIHEIMEGDVISFIAGAQQANSFVKKLGISFSPIKDIMIVGGGRVTYYIAKSMKASKLKGKLKIIEIDKDRCDFLADEFPDATIINGDGTDQDLLIREGLENTDAFCSLTGFDEENIMLSLYAGKMSHARLVTKINRISFDDVVNELNLGSIIYPKQIVADYIVQYVRALQNSQGSNVETLYKIADGKAEALEFKVGNNNELIKHTFAELKFKKNVLIAAIVRGNKLITPGGSDYMLPGDNVIVITTNTGFNDLKDILA